MTNFAYILKFSSKIDNNFFCEVICVLSVLKKNNGITESYNTGI